MYLRGVDIYFTSFTLTVLFIVFSLSKLCASAGARLNEQCFVCFCREDNIF